MKARAEALDGEVVEGYYYCEKYVSGLKEHVILKDKSSVFANKQINLDTLEYKINNEWYTLRGLELLTKLMGTGLEAHNEGRTMVAYMTKEQYGAYMDWSMQNGYR